MATVDEVNCKSKELYEELGALEEFRGLSGNFDGPVVRRPDQVGFYQWASRLAMK
jgi:hypothetical protein